MARVLIRLKFLLWRRSFRKNIGKLIGTIIGCLYGVGFLFTIMAGLITMSTAGNDYFGMLARGLGVLAILLWLLGPLLAFGVDDTLDLRKFAVLGRRARDLQPGLLAAAAISLPSLFTLLVALMVGVVSVFWVLMNPGVGTLNTVLTIIALPIAIAAGYITCLLGPRAVLARAALQTSSRKRREIMGPILLILFIAVLFGGEFYLISSATELGMPVSVEALTAAIKILAWTPFGAAFCVPFDLADGDYLAAIVRALVAAATIVLLWRWWRRTIEESMLQALLGDESSGTTKVTALVPKFLPSNPLGAVAGRSLKYWRRDSRYVGAIGITPLMLIFFIGMGLVNPHMSFLGIFGILLVASLTGGSLMNEIGMDGPAGWVNITAGLDARSNLLGRIIAEALFTLPFIILATIVVPSLFGLPVLIVPLLLISIGMYLGSGAISLLTAVILAFPAAAPGTSPFKDRSSNSVNAVLASFIATFGMWVPMIPAFILGIFGFFGQRWALWVAGPVGLLTGVGLFFLFMHINKKILNKRYVDIFQKVRAFK
ncbi:hypothetical protein [Devriesea agamarum]|uniref:hypothetical protein n=1 Tax=Devriesea agamarum TaxID=472569 RepID=UPI00071D0516|nr:hypothetical protein [Devriesea agamarum]